MARKTIVITGCSSGFGRYTALDLAGRGWHVFATVRKDADQQSLLDEAITKRCQENLTVLLCDITQSEQVMALARTIEGHLRDAVATELPLAQALDVPRLDALLNNAGTAYAGPIEFLPLDDLRAQLELNLIAHVAVTQVLLPMLKVARGRIINVSSISGQIATPVMGAYAASKFALEGLSDALRLELAPFGVRVVLIEPASSATAIWETSMERALKHLNQFVEQGPYVRLLQTTIKAGKRSSKHGFPIQRFADVVVKILTTEKPRARYGVPGEARLFLFLHRFLPNVLWDRLIRGAMRW